MSRQGESRKTCAVIAFMVGATLVLSALAILIGGILLIRKPAATVEPSVPPLISPMPSPTTVPTVTPLPPDAPVLQPTRGVSNLYIEYIFDASGSMLDLLPDGISKRDAAHDYLIAHLLKFGPETHIGLRVYGHRVRWQEDKEKSCQDIELIAPVDVGQMESIAEWSDNFQCLGMTPLYASVEMALEDFHTSDPNRLNTIILISDGMETCGKDPCELAESVTESAMERGIHFVIHVVGLDVDAETRTQLSCIADRGGGVYYDVHNTEDLRDALDSIQEDVRADEEIVTYVEATQIALALTPTPTSRPTETPTHTPRPTETPTPRPTNTPTRVPENTRTPTPVRPTPTPKPSGCVRPTIVEFYAAPPAQGSTANFTLYYTVQGADRVEIFGHSLHPQSGTFDVWDLNTDWWALWAKVNGTPDDCYAEKSIQVDPDTIGSPGGDLTDVTVSQREITISVRDNAAIDGDIIDLTVNGAKVLSNYTLTSSPHAVAVTLNSGRNTVVVTALNEGSRSPNTVEVRVSHVTVGNAVQVSRGLHTGESASFSIHAP